ncbi:hypothetical protein ZWY2020_057382 [Hordeum vulgare]|nr:hypothetical protein ZWY2020_057382 [Hordeum vulgare]
MPAPGGYDLRNGELQGPTSLTVPGVAPVLRAAGVHNVVAASTAAVAPVSAPRASTTSSPPPRPPSPLTATPCPSCSLWHPGSHAFRLPAAPPPSHSEDALLLVGLPSGTAAPALTPTEEDIYARLIVAKEKIRALHPCSRAESAPGRTTGASDHSPFG